MAGNFFSKMASDALGISDIGRIISPKDFDKVDGDDYIFHESEEKIFFVIKSKTDEYVFTNYALIHVDGTSATSTKRTINRYDYCNNLIQNVKIETASSMDLDAEIKFVIGGVNFSIDIDKKQTEDIKDIYKSLYEIGSIQKSLEKIYTIEKESICKSVDILKNNKITINDDLSCIYENLNDSINNSLIQSYKKYYKKDYSEVFTKYISDNY